MRHLTYVVSCMAQKSIFGYCNAKSYNYGIEPINYMKTRYYNRCKKQKKKDQIMIKGLGLEKFLTN